jgi:hypothetical protein
MDVLDMIKGNIVISKKATSNMRICWGNWDWSPIGTAKITISGVMLLSPECRVNTSTQQTKLEF